MESIILAIAMLFVPITLFGGLIVLLTHRQNQREKVIIQVCAKETDMAGQIALEDDMGFKQFCDTWAIWQQWYGGEGACHPGHYSPYELKGIYRVWKEYIPEYGQPPLGTKKEEQR